MGQKRLPESLQRFVARQTTRPVTDLGDGDAMEPRSPYGSYWYRAVACILLSGRVQAKHDGTPNMTEVNRVGKEANFNQYLTERIGTFLVASDVIRFDRQGRYEAGPNLAAFWDHDDERLPAITRQAVVRLVGYQTGHPFWHPKAPEDWGLIEFLSLFFTCFRGRALVESEVGQVLHDFTRLPQDDLVQAAEGLGLEVDSVDVAGWRLKLDGRGQKALVAALYTSEWAYYAEHETTGWWFASPTGLAMLGLGPPPPAPDLATVFQVQPDLSVFAGAGLGWETLVPLFRHATIRRIDQVYEFRLDRKRLAGSPAGSAPGEELREALRGAGAAALVRRGPAGHEVESGRQGRHPLVQRAGQAGEPRGPGRDPRAPAAQGLPRTGRPARLPADQEPLEPRQLRPAVPGPGLRRAHVVSCVQVR